jgi:hypothetical protein
VAEPTKLFFDEFRTIDETAAAVAVQLVLICGDECVDVHVNLPTARGCAPGAGRWTD